MYDSLTEALVSERLYFLLVSKVVCVTEGETRHEHVRLEHNEFMQLNSLYDLSFTRVEAAEDIRWMCMHVCVHVCVCE